MPIELTISDLELFTTCPHCLWRKTRGYKPNFVGGGEQSHLRAMAREFSPEDADYLTAIWDAVGKHLERAMISDMLCREPLAYHDKKTNATLKDRLDDCLLSSKEREPGVEHRTCFPLVWKRVGGPREYLSSGEVTAVWATAFLLQQNAIAVNRAAMCFMTANAARQPWDYQVKPMAISIVSENKTIEAIQKAATTARCKKAPPRSEHCFEK